MPDKTMMHEDQLVYLKKIEGQVQGIQKMIRDGRYCVDIMTQIHSAMGALRRVQTEIFRAHLEGCVSDAIEGGSEKEKQKKIDEVTALVARFSKS